MDTPCILSRVFYSIESPFVLNFVLKISFGTRKCSMDPTFEFTERQSVHLHVKSSKNKWNLTRVLFNNINNSGKSYIKIKYSNVHMHMPIVYKAYVWPRWSLEWLYPPPPQTLVRQAIYFVCLRRVIHVYYIMTSDPTCIIYYQLLFLIYTYLEQRSPCILVHKAGYYNDSRKWDRYSL